MITVVGGLTALVAATVGMAQNDIKRVIAYSTCSQLGYMFFAIGVSAYGAAIFHLMTHAFFKALLFLGAGSVIHAMGDEQDMRKMGGIWRTIPYTYAMMWIGSLALAGICIPPFAGLLLQGHRAGGRLGSPQLVRAVRLLDGHPGGADDRLLRLAPVVHDLPRESRADRRR